MNSVSTSPGRMERTRTAGASARERDRHRVERRFRRAIGHIAADAARPGDGRDIDHDTAGALFEQRSQRANGGERAAPVRSKNLVDQPVVKAVEIAMRHKPRRPRAVDQHVEGAVAVGHVAGERIERGRVGDVRLDERMIRARERPAERIGGLLITAKDQHDAASRARERAANGRSDAAGRAGHDRHAAGQGRRVVHRTAACEYRRTRRSACSLCPQNRSIAQSREQYSPMVTLASAVTRW